jgi:hypothetical protein
LFDLILVLVSCSAASATLWRCDRWASNGATACRGSGCLSLPSPLLSSIDVAGEDATSVVLLSSDGLAGAAWSCEVEAKIFAPLKLFPHRCLLALGLQVTAAGTQRRTSTVAIGQHGREASQLLSAGHSHVLPLPQLRRSQTHHQLQHQGILLRRVSIPMQQAAAPIPQAAGDMAPS